MKSIYFSHREGKARILVTDDAKDTCWAERACCTKVVRNVRYYRRRGRGSRGPLAVAFGLGIALACICPARFLLMILAIAVVFFGIAFLKCWLMEVMTNESSRSKESKSAKGAFKAHIRNKKGRLMYFKRQYIRINFAKGQNGSCLILKQGCSESIPVFL